LLARVSRHKLFSRVHFAVQGQSAVGDLNNLIRTEDGDYEGHETNSIL